MNVRLQSLLTRAESLPEDRQDILADIVESFMAAEDEDDLFTPEEIEHIRRIEAEPFDLANPEEVRAFFSVRG